MTARTTHPAAIKIIRAAAELRRLLIEAGSPYPTESGRDALTEADFAEINKAVASALLTSAKFLCGDAGFGSEEFVDEAQCIRDEVEAA